MLSATSASRKLRALRRCRPRRSRSASASSGPEAASSENKPSSIALSSVFDPQTAEPSCRVAGAPCFSPAAAGAVLIRSRLRAGTGPIGVIVIAGRQGSALQPRVRRPSLDLVTRRRKPRWYRPDQNRLDGSRHRRPPPAAGPRPERERGRASPGDPRRGPRADFRPLGRRRQGPGRGAQPDQRGRGAGADR